MNNGYKSLLLFNNTNFSKLVSLSAWRLGGLINCAKENRRTTVAENGKKQLYFMNNC